MLINGEGLELRLATVLIKISLSLPLSPSLSLPPSLSLSLPLSLSLSLSLPPSLPPSLSLPSGLAGCDEEIAAQSGEVVAFTIHWKLEGVLNL